MHVQGCLAQHHHIFRGTVLNNSTCTLVLGSTTHVQGHLAQHHHIFRGTSLNNNDNASTFSNSISNAASNFSYSNGSNLNGSNGLNSYDSYAASNTASTTSDKGMSNHARNSAGADASAAAAFTLPSDGPQDRGASNFSKSNGFNSHTASNTASTFPGKGASNNSTGAPSSLPRPMSESLNPKP